MPAPKDILDLVERFQRNLGAYKSKGYNETQLRREFVDPFFKALGWDVENEGGLAEAYKQVVHEDRIKVGGLTKAPDYSFRIGGVRKFFLETKAPHKDLKQDPEPAYQVRRYAWSAKLPLSILTDFEEFAVYDCRIKPKQGDKASVARTIYIRYDEYAARWDEIAGLLSPGAIQKGAFDEYISSHKKKRGTMEVDEAFLLEIEKWREALAKNLALRNGGLGVRELNFAVQRTIDRIIFLRICEDRGIEPYGALQALENGTRVYRRLGELFRDADSRYNSGIFHFKRERGRDAPPDELTLDLEIDDRILKDIIKSLYYPNPYEFSEIPGEILGQIYERFLGNVILGNVISLTPGHRAKVEEKPEVRKAGGVYYTPSYIVDYIVENTVGKLLEASTPAKVAKLRIVDPACGSGSFLLGAYRKLLDWHRDYYMDKGPGKYTKAKNVKLFDAGSGDYRLTTAEKKRILLNNIYGVDIDPQAVEVTKLSLLLKVLEGESGETLQTSLRLFKERALPDLGDNIKCGNSLIGPDFYNDMQMGLLDEEERYRINVFDWEIEFPEVFERNNSGFDAVIGNPPYLFITEVPKHLRSYFEAKYAGVSYRFDLYGVFVERAILNQLAASGMLGFIIPHTLLSNDSFRSLRALVTTETLLDEIIDLGPGVFSGVKNETMLLFCRRGPESTSHRLRVTMSNPRVFPDSTESFATRQRDWAPHDGGPWLITLNPENRSVVERMKASMYSLGELCTINQGLRTGNNEKFLSNVSREVGWEPAVSQRCSQRCSRLCRTACNKHHPLFVPRVFLRPSRGAPA